MAYNTEHLTNVAHLQALAERVKEDFATSETVEKLKEKIDDIVTTGGEPNVIESIKVNGATQEIVDKTVDITVPTKISDLENDEGFQTEEEVETAIETAIAESGHASFVVVDSIPTPEEAKENVLYLVKNEETGYYDIYALIDGEIVWLDDTSVELDDYVKKEEGKGLSTNDYTDDDKEKLAGIEDNANDYVHPTYTERESGFYKIAVDETGHVSEVAEVEKSDITELGIPEQDTTYEDATQEEHGLMSATDKTKIDGFEVATDEEVEEMLKDVLGVD